MVQQEKTKDKGMLSLFMILILSLILVASGYINQMFLRVGIQLLVFMLQFVIVKNILDDYYKYI